MNAAGTGTERYQILRRLGEGGTGLVYAGFDVQLKRPVAIKRLLSSGENNEDDALLLKEAGTLAALRHPNIVTIFDVASDEDGSFIVMELLDADELSGWLRRGRVSLPHFIQIAEDLLEALIAAHAQGILHRDIKPDNVKVLPAHGGKLRVKLLDFGLARAGGASMKQTIDQRGNVLGTIHYMAPEQFIRQPLDARTDLYMLGCTLYEVLAGRKAFDGETMAAIMDRHMNHEFAPLPNLRPDIPPVLCGWVMWLMNHTPDTRPASAKESLRALHIILGRSAPQPAGTVPVKTNSAVVKPSAAMVQRQPTVQPVAPQPKVPRRQIILASSVLLFALGLWLIFRPEPIQLFNGRDLSGWNCSPGRWTVQDGAIVSQPGRDGFADLEHPQFFDDFIMEVEFMLPDVSANTGVYFRSTDPIGNPWNRKLDYQVDIGPQMTGALQAGPRDLHREGLVVQPAPDVAPGTWRILHITARGSHLEVRVDGVLTAKFDDTNIQKRHLQGTIRIEHTGVPVHFRSVRVRRL